MSETMSAIATAPGWPNESSMSRFSVPRMADTRAGDLPLPIGSARKSMSAASLRSHTMAKQANGEVRVFTYVAGHLWAGRGNEDENR